MIYLRAMARNIEIKARTANPAAVREKVVALATEGPTEIAQDDTSSIAPRVASSSGLSPTPGVS
jgi:hypothetical protein